MLFPPRDRPPRRNLRALTPREWDVVALLAEGITTGMLAARLCVSPKTIETHCAHIKAKWGITTMRELLVLAVYHKIYNL